MDLTWLALAVGVLAMLVVAYLAWSIGKEPAGTPQMDEIAGYIQEGAKVSTKRPCLSILIELLIQYSCPRGVYSLLAFSRVFGGKFD
jgi:Na+/H+-translocating membrane pyrophosphatase